MTLGITPATPDLFRSTRELCEPRLAATSVYRLLADQGQALFADEAFGDLFDDVGRRSVPPRSISTTPLSCTRCWSTCAPAFGPACPDGILEAALAMAKAAGLVGRKRVLDSTALYDAVATQDTVTMIRSAIPALLVVVDEPLGLQLRAVLKRDDDYASGGKAHVRLGRCAGPRGARRRAGTRRIRRAREARWPRHDRAGQGCRGAARHRVGPRPGEARRRRLAASLAVSLPTASSPPDRRSSARSHT
jgi:hypothetical protein